MISPQKIVKPDSISIDSFYRISIPYLVMNLSVLCHGGVTHRIEVGSFVTPPLTACKVKQLRCAGLPGRLFAHANSYP